MTAIKGDMTAIKGDMTEVTLTLNSITKEGIDAAALYDATRPHQVTITNSKGESVYAEMTGIKMSKEPTQREQLLEDMLTIETDMVSEATSLIEPLRLFIRIFENGDPDYVDVDELHSDLQYHLEQAAHEMKALIEKRATLKIVDKALEEAGGK